jgi:YfiH family protein
MKEKRTLAELDAFLAHGGFSRAKNPKHALKRSRNARDTRKQATVPAKKTEVELIRAAGWNEKWLIHGFSTRAGGASTLFGGGDLNLGLSTQDKRETVLKNRATLMRALGVTKNAKLVNAKQIHSDVIHVVDSEPKSQLTGDGLVTNVAGLMLAVQVADCVPILIYDPKNRAVGAFHAGWRGTVKRIVEKGVGLMQLQYGSDPAHLRAAIGPCIGQCCYAVGDEVIDEFRSQFAYADSLFREVYDDDPVKTKYPLLFLTARAPGHSDIGPQIHLDLVEANRRQLVDAGLRPKNIWAADECTSCNTDRLFSHRKEDGFTGRSMAVVGIRS